MYIKLLHIIIIIITCMSCPGQLTQTFPRLGRGQLRPKGLRHRGGHRGEHILPRLPRLRHGDVGQEIRGSALAAVGTEGCLGAWRSG